MATSQRSVMKHKFSEVPSANIQRSSFDRSHGLKTTFNASELIPVFVDEALPGDTFNLNMTALARMATPIYPIMDNIRLDSFFFAVPIRLIWDNWQRFNGEQDNPDDTTDYIIPEIVPEPLGYVNDSLSDYLGLPIGVPNIEHNVLFHRAYNLIFNEWFRDENLIDSVPVPKGDGPDPQSNYTILKRGKRHDYFTSALPWPQKGDSVDIPLGTEAPVLGIGTGPDYTFPASGVDVRESNASTRTYSSSVQSADSARQYHIEQDPENAGFPHIYADLTDATAATINSLRQAFQIQRLFERDARGGTRYTEIIRAHFGVTSPDARLQRPEYLGGGSTPINVVQVPQTSESDIQDPDSSPQGNLAAYATATVRNNGFTKSFTEHCVIIGLVNARADLTYQQGINRMFSRSTRFDYYWPALAHLGEQAILNKEIYAQGNAEDDDVFGYQERYAEYRYKPSMITGTFRSTAPGSLDAWHLSQEFASLPALNQTFIEEDVPMDRVIAVPSEPDFIFDSYFKLTCARPMPTYGVPGYIDHF